MMTLNYFFKQISEQILPIHMQYILYAVSENKDIFSHEEKEEADETAAPKGKDKKKYWNIFGNNTF